MISHNRHRFVFHFCPSLFSIAETGSALGREAAERVTAHQRRPFVRSAAVCPSSLQLTETLMMPKAPPALPSCIYCNSYSELCREAVGTRCPLFFFLQKLLTRKRPSFRPLPAWIVSIQIADCSGCGSFCSSVCFPFYSLSYYLSVVWNRFSCVRGKEGKTTVPNEFSSGNKLNNNKTTSNYY